MAATPIAFSTLLKDELRTVYCSKTGQLQLGLILFCNVIMSLLLAFSFFQSPQVTKNDLKLVFLLFSLIRIDRTAGSIFGAAGAFCGTRDRNAAEQMPLSRC